MQYSSGLALAMQRKCALFRSISIDWRQSDVEAREDIDISLGSETERVHSEGCLSIAQTRDAPLALTADATSFAEERDLTDSIQIIAARLIIPS